MPRSRIVLLLAVVVALQATNSAVVAVMALFVTRTPGWGYSRVFAACAALTLVALAGLGLVTRVGTKV